MQQTKLLEDILNSQASLNADESLMAFAMMLASVDEYRFYNSSKDDFTKSLAERYINNDAWVMFEDMKFRTVNPANVAHYGTERGDIHGIIYDNGGVWLLSGVDHEDIIVLLFVFNETAEEEDYPTPS